MPESACPSRAPTGQGVATLDQALADPAILERMNLPGQSPYGTSRASLLASPPEDRHPDRFQPGLLLTQDEAAPARAGRQEPNGPLPRPGGATRSLRPGAGRPAAATSSSGVFRSRSRLQLFTRPEFVQSTQQTLVLFGPEFPLVYRPDQAVARRSPRRHSGIRLVPAGQERPAMSSTRRRRSPRKSRKA